MQKYHRQVKNYSDYFRVKEHQLKDILNDYRRNTDLDSSREIERGSESLKSEEVARGRRLLLRERGSRCMDSYLICRMASL